MILSEKLQKIKAIVDKSLARIVEIEKNEAFFKQKHPILYSRETKKLEAEQLVLDGKYQNVDSALNAVNAKFKNRKAIAYCRDTAERYINQLNPLEFKGFFRMDRPLFEKIVGDLDEHFKKTNQFQVKPGGKPVTPTVS